MTTAQTASDKHNAGLLSGLYSYFATSTSTTATTTAATTNDSAATNTSEATVAPGVKQVLSDAVTDLASYARGAVSEVHDNKDREPVESHREQEKLLKVLREKKASFADRVASSMFGTSRLCRACKLNDLATVKALATADNVNLAGWLGWSPVHKAAQGGALDCMLLLVQLGADVNQRDLEGQTPLHFAAAGGYWQLVEFLLSPLANSEIDSRDQQGFSPLHLAALNGHQKVMEILLSTNKVEVSARTNESLTPLHAALGGGFSDCAILLINHGAHCGSLDYAGYTPFCVAQPEALAAAVAAYQKRKERLGIEVAPAEHSASSFELNEKDNAVLKSRTTSSNSRDVSKKLDALIGVGDQSDDHGATNADNGLYGRHDMFSSAATPVSQSTEKRHAATPEPMRRNNVAQENEGSEEHADSSSVENVTQVTNVVGDKEGVEERQKEEEEEEEAVVGLSSRSTATIRHNAVALTRSDDDESSDGELLSLPTLIEE